MNYTINFGAIKDSVLRFSAQKLIVEQKENSILNTFLKEVKSNPLFKIEYLIYRNLEEGFFKKTNLAERYINEVEISVTDNFQSQYAGEYIIVPCFYFKIV